MFSFFAPGYIKEARLVLKNAQKLLDYKRDVLSAASKADFEATMERLKKAVDERDELGVKTAAEQLDAQAGQYMPPAADAAWRENCEVFLVAIVIAIGVRTFFLQPFTIPTGSMQPTLNGIIGTPTEETPPNVAKQAYDLVMRGRNYINVVAKSEDVIVGLSERKMLFFFTLTNVQCAHSSYTVWAPASTLRTFFNVDGGRKFGAGAIIARGYIDAGDHVFVDKVSYNFHTPVRGQVFVFSTLGIMRIERELREQGTEGSQFYIKRLTGLPGDTLRIASPELFINGQRAVEFGMQRVMSAMNGYRGYSNPPPLPLGALYLTTPEETFTVPERHYFAMGDNSYNSSDSRYWGTVPEQNLMGRGLFVYWPFLPHWGAVK